MTSISEQTPQSNPEQSGPQSKDIWDAIIIGGGAAGLMAGLTAAQRGRRVLVLDHARKPAEKIRISGGGRCNFTNLGTTEKNFLSANPRFCISALRGFKPQDFLAMVEAHRIAWHEKALGQLFCDDSAQQIIDMLLDELSGAGGKLRLGIDVKMVEKSDDLYHVATSRGTEFCRSLVIATGGKSIPKMGATGFGYDIARQFGLDLQSTRAALVPFTFSEVDKAWSVPLSGLSVDAEVRFGKVTFREGLLFTHRGLSGPSILQISSYWSEGKSVSINLAPDGDALATLQEARMSRPKQDVATVLATVLPKRLAKAICEREKISGNIAQLGDKALRRLDECVHRWQVNPIGTEGYRTAEVTLGGVDTRALSQKTMEARDVPGLYFIGEVVDVTGQLGGYNFQWAWASGRAAGLAL
ncbi:NAD(P)/FAD-dependent oxidoreductase [Cohaesibacter sp. ES.047]|uniref:NAD(P)/FAD-dependent oxidoreductase n=1 Tax=Cohaesibacter sp. ES.047 TaxID=1798205 RepID=UPI000BB75D56|nr:NAD(P)/FAD-dependent oxidoreductase [Cohaesibacter sp. ES.047]